MNLIVQPRHTKLWLAGHEANWALAEYEIKELRSALANVAKARPVFRERSVAESVEMFMGGAFRGIDEAIKARDAGQVRRGLCDRERGLQRLSHRAQPIPGRDQDAGAAVLSGPGIPRPEVTPSASWWGARARPARLEPRLDRSLAAPFETAGDAGPSG